MAHPKTVVLPVGRLGNYLANVPEIIDTAKAIKARLPGCFVFVGGHSASFVAADLLARGAGAIDCVIKGDGNATRAGAGQG